MCVWVTDWVGGEWGESGESVCGWLTGWVERGESGVGMWVIDF